MVNLVTALKNQITQMYQLVTNQIDMTNSHEFRDTAEQTALLTNQVKLMKKCLQIELLTNQVGAAQKKTIVPIVGKTKALAAGVCAIELLTNQVGAAQTKTTVPTVANTKTRAAGVGAAQQNEYDTTAGPKLLMAARDGDASRVQTLLSAPDVQSYINYTDKDGRTSLLYAAFKGHAPIVEKLIAAGCNIDLGQIWHKLSCTTNM